MRTIVLSAVGQTFAILCRGEVSEWLMVPLSKSGVRKHRGFESRPLRQNPRGDLLAELGLAAEPEKSKCPWDVQGAGFLLRGEVA